MRKAVTSSVGSQGVKSAAVCSAAGLMEVSVDDGDVSSSLRSCVIDAECAG